MVKASRRPSGDQARPAGDSVKLLMAAVTPLLAQYTNNCVEPSASAPRYAMRVPSGDQRGAALDAALDSGRACSPSAPDQPHDAARPIRLDVETHAHVGNAAAVGRDLGIAHPLQIEDIERFQGRVSRSAQTPGARQREQEQGRCAPHSASADRSASRSFMPISSRLSPSSGVDAHRRFPRPA